MMEKPTCKTCPYWESIEDLRKRLKHNTYAYPYVETTEGMCHSSPNTVLSDETYWCSKHPNMHAWIGIKNKD